LIDSYFEAVIDIDMCWAVQMKRFRFSFLPGVHVAEVGRLIHRMGSSWFLVSRLLSISESLLLSFSGVSRPLTFPFTFSAIFYFWPPRPEA
jgi:hypothetical protein